MLCSKPKNKMRLNVGSRIDRTRVLSARRRTPGKYIHQSFGQCCGSRMFIWNPGSRFFSCLVAGSNNKKEEGKKFVVEKNWLFLLFLLSYISQNLKLFCFFDQVQNNISFNWHRIGVFLKMLVESEIQKNLSRVVVQIQGSKSTRPWILNPGSWIPDPGSGSATLHLTSLKKNFTKKFNASYSTLPYCSTLMFNLVISSMPLDSA